jgi:DNA-directed RNA polymerase specialized sigma subunit
MPFGERKSRDFVPYELDCKNSDVARELHVNESRISQIKHVALAKLRVRLQGKPSGVAA